MPRDVQVVAATARVASLCAELERRLTAGEDYRSEQVFESHPELAEDAEVAIEVIYTEFVTRDQLRQRPSPSDYLARFPHLRTPLQQLFEIHGAVGKVPESVGDEDRSLGQLPRPGRRVANYELLEEIGRGGMGVVYKARQAGLDRLVALKMILSGADASPTERARFRSEAEAAARLQHPGIVQVFQVGEHAGHPFLVFEYLPGGSLDRRLDGKPWTTKEAARLVESLAAAVQHAHDHGVVHRDLKPANVLLQKGEGGRVNDEAKAEFDSSTVLSPSPVRAKIGDFGLAHKVAADQATPRPGLTVTGTIIGTPAYMAPEQTASGSAIGAAADVYSLGAILFELLTGRPPFQGLDALDILNQVRTREPVPPSRLIPSVPGDLETICLKCLRKDPRQRYSSAAELEADLGRFLRGEPIRARPVSPWERAWKWARRNTAVAGLLGTVALLVLAGVITITVLWRQTAAALVNVRSERNEKEAALATKTIALAENNWLFNDLDAAREQLDDCPPAYRDSRWSYLDRACRSRLLVIPNQSRKDGGAPSSIVWSPDGRLLGVGQVGSGMYRILDLGVGRELYVMATGRTSLLRQAAFLPGDRIITASTPALLAVTRPGGKGPEPSIDLDLRRWDAATGRELSASITKWPNTLGKLTEDGRQFVGYYNKQLFVIDLPGSPEPRIIDVTADVPAILPKQTVSYDGRFLAGWFVRGPTRQQSRQYMVVLDTRSGSSTCPLVDLTGNSTNHFALSPDGTHLAVAVLQLDTNLGHVSILDVRTGGEVFRLRGHTLTIDSLAYSPDGTRLATGSSDKTVILWDAQTGREIMTFRGLSATVTSMAFSPDSTRLAGACRDGSAHIWNARPFDEP